MPSDETSRVTEEAPAQVVEKSQVASDEKPREDVKENETPEKKGKRSPSKKEQHNDAPKNKFLETLSIAKVIGEQQSSKSDGATMPCLLCDEMWPATVCGSGNPLLAHLMQKHKFIIAEVQNVSNFVEYIQYWKKRLQEVTELTDICVLINTNTGENDVADSEKFHLLTDFLPEDHALRDRLAKTKLTGILEEHLHERSDEAFSRQCLFCREMFTGKGRRLALFRHMALDHSFNLGNADNIVNAHEMLDKLEVELNANKCLFCETQFEDWPELKEHMRKKGHKRINPKNKDYDKYYLINYLDPGKNWKDMQHDPEYENEEDGDDSEQPAVQEKDWDDWKEEAPLALCLFCGFTSSDPGEVFEHMRVKHNFDIAQPNTTFYDRTKMVNYIRRKVYLNICPNSGREFPTKAELEKHLEDEKYCNLPEDRKEWDLPEYFFPTFEDDALLFYLQDDDSDDEDEQIDMNQNKMDVTAQLNALGLHPKPAAANQFNPVEQQS